MLHCVVGRQVCALAVADEEERLLEFHLDSPGFEVVYEIVDVVH